MSSTRDAKGTTAFFSGAVQQALLLWMESRPVVQVMIAARFTTAGLLSGEEGRRTWELATGLLVWATAGIAVYVFNGAMDVTEDRANGSSRPIASGRLDPGRAIWYSAAMTALALAGGAYLQLSAQVALFLALGYLYSGPPSPAKRSAVTASVTTIGLGAATFWAGGQSAGATPPAVIVFATVMSAWIGLVGALVKDLGDLAGDALAGRRTSVVVHGAAGVRYCAALFAVLLGVSGLLSAYWYAPRLLPAMLTLSAGAAWTARRCVHPVESPGRDGARRPYRAFMATQYAATTVAAATVLLT